MITLTYALAREGLQAPYCPRLKELCQIVNGTKMSGRPPLRDSRVYKRQTRSLEIMTSTSGNKETTLLERLQLATKVGSFQEFEKARLR